jgi:hypothetical protein
MHCTLARTQRQEAHQPQWVLWCPLQIVIDVLLYGHFGALLACFDVAFPVLVLFFSYNIHCTFSISSSL